MNNTTFEQFKMLLAHLHRGGRWSYYWHMEGAQKISTWFAADDPPPPPRDWDVYFSVNPTLTMRAKNRRATTELICGISCLFAEFDDKDFAGGRAEILRLIFALPLPPSVLVDSGGGVHAYWLFTDPFVFENEHDRERAAALQKRWVEFTGGDDNAKDLARVLRLPGTLNHKPEYNPPRPVKFLVTNEKARYQIEDFETLCPAEEKPRAAVFPTIATPGNGSNGHRVAIDVLLERALAMEDRNAGGLWLGCQLRDNDYTELEAAPIMLTYQNIRKDEKSHAYTENEARATTRSAYSRPPREPWANEEILDNADETEDGDSPEVEETNPPVEPTPAPEPANRGKGKRKRGLLTTAKYADILADLGYSFAYNLCTHVVEVNGTPLDDNMDAKIRTQLRDAKILEVRVVADVMRVLAVQNEYHPVRRYLETLEWTGENVIHQVAQHFSGEDEDDLFERFFSRWCIGAVARIMQDNAQNRVLLLAGKQGLGKDTFAKWLCSPLPAYYNDSAIRPDDKDNKLRLLSVWIWNVSEVGSTMRRQDREALKHVITIQQVRERKPYAHHDTTGNAISSFIGSFNDDGSGVLNDPTGTRRFAIVPITTINWDYMKHDIHQLWAQAVQNYRDGMPWNFDEKDRQSADKTNEDFQSPNIVEETLQKFFTIDPAMDHWMASVEIVEALKNPVVGNLKIADPELFRQMATALKKLGLEKPRPKRGEGSQLRGYTGIERV